MKQFFTLLGIVALGSTSYGQTDTDIVNIPDKTLKYILVRDKKVDTNGDGEISYGEAKVPTLLNLEAVTGVTGADKIEDMTGIEAFVNLKHLYVTGTSIKSLDLSKNTTLTYVYANDCKYLESINLTKNTELESLGCADTKLTDLDLSKNTKLRFLNCSNSRLTGLDISNNPLLKDLYCENNQILSLDVSKNTLLRTLSCSNNLLSSLDVSKNTALKHISCSDNQITRLDINKNKSLENLSCNNNQLVQLNLANGMKGFISNMSAQNNPNLTCIQIDSGFIPWSNWWLKDDHAIYSDNCNYPSLSTTEIKSENDIQILSPVKDNLVIKTTAKVEKIEIYNTAGQLVKVLFRGNTLVQDLAKGVYLVKITTDKGVITEKIIKS